MSILFDKLSIITESLNFLRPEVILIAAILIIIFVDLIGKQKAYYYIQLISFVSLGLVVWTTIGQMSMTETKPITLFLRMLQVDQPSVFWKLILDVGLFLTLCINLRDNRERYRAEFISMLFFILLGAHLIVMSNNLLMVYLSIEMMSIGAYVLTTYSFRDKGYEAGIKYLLFGGVSSAIMLYGMSLMYAITGSLEFTTPLFTEALMSADVVPLVTAGIMVMAGLLFKVSAAPMHIWAPDVYEVAPTPAVAFFSVVPKLAGFAILVKWLLVINLFGLGDVPWPKILGGIAIITLTIGNFSALWQSNVKRMLAYSSIAHSGFLLMGLLAFSTSGMQSLLFYAAVYVIMNLAAFLLVNFFEVKKGAFVMDDYKGLMNEYPMLTVLMVLIMISLTGLPPTAGFTAKLFVFSSVWESYTNSGESWLIFVFIFGLLNAVVSLFYYLKLPYYMIFKAGKETPVAEVPILENFLSTILVVGLLILFFRPDWLMNMINSVNFAF